MTGSSLAQYGGKSQEFHVDVRFGVYSKSCGHIQFWPVLQMHNAFICIMVTGRCLCVFIIRKITISWSGPLGHQGVH